MDSLFEFVHSNYPLGGRSYWRLENLIEVLVIMLCKGLQVKRPWESIQGVEAPWSIAFFVWSAALEDSDSGKSEKWGKIMIGKVCANLAQN